MKKVLITGTGSYIPKNIISNKELVDSFNTWVEKFNLEHSEEIASGAMEAKRPSSVEFIEKASGIKQRYVIEKSGILDIERMRPKLTSRGIDEPSITAEMALNASQKALTNAGLQADDLDLIISAGSVPERAYPAVSIELQNLLGVNDAYAYDMNLGCASAMFAIKMARDAIATGTAKRALVVNAEIVTGHVDFHNRDSHFIFGDACSAIILEAEDVARENSGYEIMDIALVTKFSNNIRNDFGFLTPNYEPALPNERLLFQQNGNKVFKEVTRMVVDFVGKQFERNNVSADDVKRAWLHQANYNMDLLIAKKLFNREITSEFMPMILDKYANVSSAGTIISFHETKEELASGDVGLICAFGAGYSIGSILIKRR